MPRSKKPTPPGHHRCTKCDRAKPYTTEHFRPSTRPVRGHPLVQMCRECEGKRETWELRPDLGRTKNLARFEQVAGDLAAVHGPMGGWPIEVHREFTRRLSEGTGVRAQDPRIIHRDEVVVLPLDYSSPLLQQRLDAVRRRAEAS